MMRPTLFAFALLLATPAAGFARTCGDAVERLAADAGIDLTAPESGAATSPSPPATSESMGVAVMDHLEQPDAVVRPDTAGDDAAPDEPARSEAETEARRIQAEALLWEARAAAADGRDAECRDKLAAAEPLLADTQATGEGDGPPPAR
ncbi:hypothetical protein [Azospirillum halopraeferens]|uniref:hypothetical protein n=1 Tax=Azospirillum halopraeferens TaxID=34010 RepID=UPI0003FBB773|nr:hypothetical protein [Azospirillum halopraeferens]